MNGRKKHTVNNRVAAGIIIFLALPFFSYAQKFSVKKVYEKVKDAVVLINVIDTNQKVISKGSGVIIFSEKDSYRIVTNYHIFSGGNRLQIIKDGNAFSDVDIIGADIEKDLLLLKMNKGKNLTNLHPINFAKDSAVDVGEKIYTVSCQFGYENIFTEGMISGIKNEAGKRYVFFTAPISEGSSGGALVNGKGELIGITTMTVRGSQNLNLAISISEIYKIQIQDENNPDNMEAYNYFIIGRDYLLNGNIDYEKVKMFFLKATELNPNLCEAYLYLGYIYDKLGEYKSTVENYKKVVELQK